MTKYKGHKIRNKLCPKEVWEEGGRQTEQRTYGHKLSNEARRTRVPYSQGKVRRANTLAQNIVRGGRAPSPKKAIKEEI